MRRAHSLRLMPWASNSLVLLTDIPCSYDIVITLFELNYLYIFGTITFLSSLNISPHRSQLDASSLKSSSRGNLLLNSVGNHPYLYYGNNHIAMSENIYTTLRSPGTPSLSHLCYIFTATISELSLNLASCTWPNEAHAIGSFVIKSYISSTSLPKSYLIIALTSFHFDLGAAIHIGSNDLTY